MKIKYIDEDIFDIYIIKDRIKNVDFNSDKELEKYLKRLFKVLKNDYRIDIEGFYDVCIYIDKYYGIVIHMEKEKLEYYNYYKEIDMRITIKESIFLYQIDNYIKNKKIHIIDNNMYLEITNSNDLIKVIENCNNILYNYCE
jgi:hypothetical protein